MGELADTVNNVAFVAIFVIVVIVYIVDVYILSYGKGQHTISQAILVVAQQYPMLPFMIGILVGHILWPLHNHD